MKANERGYRWDILQNVRSPLDSMIMWVVIIVAIFAMAITFFPNDSPQ